MLDGNQLIAPLCRQHGERCLLWVVISDDQRNTLSKTQKMTCMLMNQRNRRGFTVAEKAEMWDRWKRAGAAEVDWASVWQAIIVCLSPVGPARGIETLAERFNACVASIG